MEIKLTTIAVYNNAIDAHLAKTKLDSEGIVSFIMDENLVSINPLLNLTIGGVKLKTNNNDAEKAKEILGIYPEI